MKQCPECKTVYKDEGLRFCVNDGAILTETADGAGASDETVMLSRSSEETVFLPRHKNAPPKNPLRIDINPPDAPAPPVAAVQPNSQLPPLPVAAPPVSKSFNPVIIGVLGAALLLLIGGGALVVFLASRSSGDVRTDENKKVAAAVSPSPSSSVSTNSSSLSASEGAPGDDAAQLRAEMANLQKQIQDQKNQKQTAPPNAGSTSKQPTVSSSSLSSPQTARANSPRDGFLALRDEPNSKNGYRIAQIPHGAVITVVDCPRPSNVGKIPGRWCQVVYNGQSGWAFDAFIRF